MMQTGSSSRSNRGCAVVFPLDLPYMARATGQESPPLGRNGHKARSPVRASPSCTQDVPRKGPHGQSRLQRMVPDVAVISADLAASPPESEGPFTVGLGMTGDAPSPGVELRGSAGDAIPDHSVPRLQESALSDVAVSETAARAGKGAALEPRAHMSREDAEMLAAVAPQLLEVSEQSAAVSTARVQGLVAPLLLCPGTCLGAAPDSVAELAWSAEGGKGVCGDAALEVEISLACLRGHSQGGSDVIGALDFSSGGTHFATGGIARKIRLYSLAHLKESKAELLASREEKRSKSSEEGDEDDEDFDDLDCASSEEGRRGQRRRLGEDGMGSVPFFLHNGHGGLRRKRKASSTSNLEDFFEKACQRRAREHYLDSDACASKIICAPAKISSLQWVPGKEGAIGCGDYDGALTEWDVETGMCVSERDEHQGQKIWSIRYCPDPALGLAASASEDGSVRLWAGDTEECVSTIRPCPGSALCSVDFNEDGTLLAMGGADSAVYVYDLRQSAKPLLSLLGHSRTVSYIRMMTSSTLVSSSIDSSVKVWDISSACSSQVSPKGATGRPLASAAHHINRRSFVGLAVRADGSIMTGSETNEMVGYRYSAGRPLQPSVCLDFGSGLCTSSPSADTTLAASMGRKPFVSALSWQDGSYGPMLGAANSDGVIRLLKSA